MFDIKNVIETRDFSKMTLGLSSEEILKRYLYTSGYYGTFIIGDRHKNNIRYSSQFTYRWAVTAREEFTKIITTVSEDPLLVRRTNFFYFLAEGLCLPTVPDDFKAQLKELIFKLVQNDQDFFDFIKFYTIQRRESQNKLTTTLRKMIIKFYQNKEPLQFAETVARQESYHGWYHADLFRLCHFKTDKVGE